MAHIQDDQTLMEAFAMSESDPRPFPVLDPASVEPRRGAAYPEHLRSPFAAREKRALGDPLDDGTDGSLDSPLEGGGFEPLVPRYEIRGFQRIPGRRWL